MPKAASPKHSLKIKLVKSPSGYHYKLREVLRGLGLRRLHHEVLRLDTPAVRGMVRKVGHLVRVQEVQ